MSRPLAAFLVLLMPSLVTGEYFQFHNVFGNGESIKIDKQGRQLTKTKERKLQLDVGTLGSINATTDTCRGVGPGIECDIDTVISADDGDLAQVQVRVTCPLDSQTAFDFRRAVGCGCGARVTKNGEFKDCPCIVCPMGFGTSPVSIDCTDKEDPFIISTCSFLDCGFGCNGTCEFSCKESGPSCSFCANNPNAPTLAPTGYDGSREPSLIPSSKANGAASTLGALALSLAAIGFQLLHW
mmetsp:Transcript_19190/g.41255  ORF Transcript_19190/g.41255 Transcript_19190/m.41255 type:complete len:240 (+) Transcript_19190:119-838(+)